MQYLISKILPSPTKLDASINEDFRPLLMIFAPNFIRFENAEIIEDKLEIDTIFNEEINPSDAKVSIIGKSGKSAVLRKLVNFDKIKHKKDIPIHSRINSQKISRL